VSKCTNCERKALLTRVSRLLADTVFFNTTLKFAKPVPPTFGRPDFLFKAIASMPRILDDGRTVVIRTIYYAEGTYPDDFRRSLDRRWFGGPWPGPATLFD
jgi:hypothetical protein